MMGSAVRIRASAPLEGSRFAGLSVLPRACSGSFSGLEQKEPRNPCKPPPGWGKTQPKKDGRTREAVDVPIVSAAACGASSVDPWNTAASGGVGLDERARQLRL